MQIDAVLFDKDGTLVLLDETWLPAYRRAAEWLATAAGKPEAAMSLLEGYGYDAATGRLVHDTPLACGTTSEIVEAWTSVFGDLAPPNAREEIFRIFEHQTIFHPVPTTPLRPLMTALKERGLTIGLATMDTEAGALGTLRALGVADLFDFHCGADSGHGIKPDPGMALAFATAVGCPIERVAMVGDATKDLRMGRAAGCGATIGVLTGAAARAVLEPLANLVLDSVAELPAALDTLTKR